MTENRKLCVFLCHASQDKPIVREMYQRLLAESWIDPWLDEEKLLPGQDWDLEIEKAVEVSDAIIVFLSDNSVTKEGYIQRELRMALRVAEEKPEGAIFIIPVRLNECIVPRRLRDWQFVDYYPPSKVEKSYARILESLILRGGNIGLEIKQPRNTLRTNQLTNKDRIIEFIKINKSVTVPMLVKELGIQPQNIHVLLSRLSKEGLIVITIDKDNAKKYGITAKGVAYYGRS